MDIKYFIEPIFKIEFFKIQCVNFKGKKEHIEKILDQYPEIPFPNFYSNRNKANITWELQEIFKGNILHDAIFPKNKLKKPRYTLITDY